MLNFKYEKTLKKLRDILLTENQEKIDITYYKLNFEIDFDDEKVIGSVIINGSVGMNQPDFIEFDFMLIFCFWGTRGTLGVPDLEILEFAITRPMKHPNVCQ